MMNAIKDFFYQRIVTLARGVTIAQGLQIRTWGEENIPDKGGAVLVVNHTGYMDFVFGGFIPHQKKRLVRFLAKAAIFKTPVVGPLLNMMGHVPVDRIDGGESIRRGIELAKAGELVGVFAEGTISRSFEIRSMRSGAARIAYEAGVPVIPMVVFGSQRIWTKGQKKNLGRSNTPLLIRALEPFTPTGDVEADTAEIRRRMQAGVEGLWKDYEAEFGPMPKGAFWVPARMGGGAPTLEEAEREDKAVESERYRVRRLRDDLMGLKTRITEATSELLRERLAITAKPSTDELEELKHTAPETLDWVKENLNSVLEEATRGLEEGRDKVSEIMAQLKLDVAEAQANLATSSREVFAGSVVEQGLLGAATQSRLIVSRLPHRMKANFTQIPRIVVADESAMNYDGDSITTRLHDAFAGIYPESEILILVSPQAAQHPDSTFDPIQQELWRIEHQGGVVKHGSEVIAVHALDDATVTAIESIPEMVVEWSREGDDIVSGHIKRELKEVAEQLGEVPGIGLIDTPAGLVVVAAEVNRWNATQRILDTVAAEPKDITVFAGEDGDEVYLDHAQVVALETAPIELVKEASSVTYSADRAGIPEVLEAMAKLNTRR
ncbi:lysophospholipid acyltransferase family protein [Corynebacterium striatum]|uniref:lysophospholipid acyltransferase family protein n=1 Tax=Corynebacterium striatum TaxID=43770 RepID=UPI00254F1BC2|nr:1-acyl-sn-glycerol-3-phosphate acyltransferase [Corynebacterium striatum]MDK8831814.1 1-acyl-sn-glycerol-3-phosphate acyltransferase [Corynebacterium striatum]